MQKILSVINFWRRNYIPCLNPTAGKWMLVDDYTQHEHSSEFFMT